MHELGFEDHFNNETFDRINYETNICKQDNTITKEIKLPTLKTEIQIITNNKKNLKKEIKDINKRFELIFNELKFNIEKTSFIKLKPSLLKNKKYINKYVAIHNGKIIGCGDDKIELLKYVYNIIGYKPIYIDKVTKEKTVYKFPSPKEIK